MAWYNSSWGYRIKLTIDATKVDADLTDYPVYVDLSNLPADFHSHVKAGGVDIRVTKGDETTELPREIVSYDADTDTGEMYFKYSGTLSGSTDTDVYLYYGNSGASDYAVDATYGAQNAWNSSFINVYHMKDASTSTVSDSTATGATGTKGAANNPAEATGKIGKGQDFDGGDIINAGDVNGLDNLEQITAEAWVKWEGGSMAINSLVRKQNASDATFALFTLNSDKPTMWVRRDGVGDWYNSGNATTGIATGAFFYVVGTYNHVAPKIYVNGALEATGASITLNTYNGSAPLCIGAYDNGGTPGQTWNGVIDEVRTSNTARSTEWISTTYNNINSPSTFYDVGTEEAGGVSIAVPAGTLTVSTPTVTTLRSVYLTVPTGSLSVSTPTVTTLVGRGVSVPVGNLSISTPTLVAAANESSLVGKIFISEPLSDWVAYFDYLPLDGRYALINKTGQLYTDNVWRGTNTFDGDVVLNGSLAGTSVKDEDNMASDSATSVPTQQSTKAYVDTHAADTSTHGVTTIAGLAESQQFTGTNKFGSSTNYLQIDNAGDLLLVGTAKYERHVQIEAVTTGAVANQPTDVDFFTAGGLQYPTTGAKYAYCQWEIPDDWDGTDIVFEVDWFPDSGAISGTDAVRWTVEYRAIAEGELINAGTSVTLDNGAGGDTTDYAQYKTKHTRFTLTYNNANQPLTAQDHVYFKISRDTSVANDFGGSVTVTAYEIIYQSKGFPSSN